MRILIVIVALTILFAGYAKADLYHWKDKKGVVHITDSLGKVPEEYRDKVEVRKSTPKMETDKGGAETQPAASQTPQTEELFGDHPLAWWVEAFKKIGVEISGIESSLASKRQFVSLFESGRRVGQIFDEKDVQTYERYTKEIPEEESRLEKLKSERSELLRKATNAGVPRNIRGD